MALDPYAIASAVEEIEAAFGGLAPPGDDALLHPQCRDDNDIAEFYGAPRWQDLPGDFLVRNYAAPSFFSAEAFREYLAEATLRAFDPGAPGDPLHGFQASKFALFGAAQRRAVAAFLAAFRGEPDLGEIAEAALKYWK